MDSPCILCKGLRGHARLRSCIEDELTQMWQDAQAEFLRLEKLHGEICWYNFEVKVRDWNLPWAASILHSEICLHGMVIEKGWCRESGRFPEFYRGPIQGAPLLPPEIILTELNLAKEELDRCTDNLMNATDWAPGGCKYRKLRDETMVPTARKKALEAAHLISKRLEEYNECAGCEECD